MHCQPDQCQPRQSCSCPLHQTGSSPTATSRPNGGRPATFSVWNRTAFQRAACSYSWTEGRQVQSTAEVIPAWSRRWIDWSVSFRIISVTTLAFTDFTMPLLSFICIIVPFECVYECMYVSVCLHLSFVMSLYVVHFTDGGGGRNSHRLCGRLLIKYYYYFGSSKLKNIFSIKIAIFLSGISWPQWPHFNTHEWQTDAKLKMSAPNYPWRHKNLKKMTYDVIKGHWPLMASVDRGKVIMSV